MKVYQINYDLRKQRNYDALYQKIKSYDDWCHLLESCWIVVTAKTPVQIRDELRSVIDSDDGLLVTRLNGEAAWHKLNFDTNSQVTNWLRKNLSSAT